MGIRSGILVGVVVAVAAVGMAGSAYGNAAAPGRATAGGLSAGDVQGLLNGHNALRAKYGTPPLVWDKKLAALAQQWADTRAKTGAVHKPNNSNGQNTFWSAGTPRTSKYVIDDWAGEVKDYDLTTNVCKPTKVCSHFTQVVWKSTKRIGCGRASGNVPPAGISWKGKIFYWVCDYAPRGNFAGRNFTTG